MNSGLDLIQFPGIETHFTSERPDDLPKLRVPNIDGEQLVTRSLFRPRFSKDRSSRRVGAGRYTPVDEPTPCHPDLFDLLPLVVENTWKRGDRSPQLA